MANPNVRRSVLIESNMNAIARSSTLIEQDLKLMRGDVRVAYRHCTCAGQAAQAVGASKAERESALATNTLHKTGCAIHDLMRQEALLIEELRRANAALEAGAPLEQVAA